MGYRLKNRQVQIPNGMVYYQPQTKWSSSPWASFDTIVNQVIAHRRSNPWLVTQGLSVDPEQVANEVDEFNAQICAYRGWREFIVGGDVSPPFSPPQPVLPGRLGRVAAGAKTLVKWIGSGAESVPQSKADQRAAVCASCPLNTKGDLMDFFTVPVSEAIRAAFSDRSAWGLKTPHDDKLNVCEVCLCPLKLKIHMPITSIVKDMAPETLNALPGYCWIEKERKE